MEFFLIGGLVVGIVAGGVWFLLWSLGGGARKQGERVMERAERRRAQKGL